jgi:hypothetical protein
MHEDHSSTVQLLEGNLYGSLVPLSFCGQSTTQLAYNNTYI